MAKRLKSPDRASEAFDRTVSKAKTESEAQQLIQDVGATLEGFLKQRGLSKSAAAKLFRQPESFINNRIRGHNMTLRSLAQMFATLGGEVTVVVKRRKRAA